MGPSLLALVAAAAVGAPSPDTAPPPDGPRLLIPSARSGVSDLFLVDPATGDAKNLTRTEQAEELYPAWGPDGKRIAFVCKTRDHSFEVFVADADGANRKMVSQPPDGASACFAPAWSPDGKALAYARGYPGDKYEVRVAAADGTADDAVQPAAFAPVWCPDGKAIAFVRREAGKPFQLAVMNADGSGAKTLVADIGRPEFCLPAWSPDGRLIAYPAETAYGWQIFVASPAGGPPRQLTHLAGFCVNPVWLSADRLLFAHLNQLNASGGAFATIKADGSRLSIDPLTKQEPPHVLGRPAAFVARVEPAAARPAKPASEPGAVRPVGFTEPAARRAGMTITPITYVPPSVPGAIGAVAWAADGKRFAVGLEAGPVVVAAFDGKTVRPAEAFRGHEGPAEAVAFSPDGAALYSAGADHSVRTWDAAGKGAKAVVTEHGAWVDALAVSADGRWLAAGDRDGAVRVRAAATGKVTTEVTVCDPKRGGVHAVAFGKGDAVVYAAVARWDVPVLNGAVAAFDPATGKEVWRTKGTFGGVFALAVSPDGSKLAGACLDSYVRVWDAATGKELGCWKGHADRATGVAWAAGGRVVVSCGFDHTVRVWDAATGELRHTLAAHAGPVVRVAVAPDGRHFLSTAQAGSLFVWKLTEE